LAEKVIVNKYWKSWILAPVINELQELFYFYKYYKTHAIIMVLDKTHGIKDVTVENIILNGKQPANPDATEHIKVEPFAPRVISKNKNEDAMAGEE